MVPETCECFVKLHHDVTWTLDQVNSELCIHGSTSVGWYFPAAPWLGLCEGRPYLKPRLVSNSGSDGAKDLGKPCKAAS